jgi:hypothetical protein
MHTYKATITTNDRKIPTTVQAETESRAKALLEAQYGRGNVSFIQRM